VFVFQISLPASLRPKAGAAIGPSASSALCVLCVKPFAAVSA
jgi:hypothetical protein